jgi:hypothetical protein
MGSASIGDAVQDRRRQGLPDQFIQAFGGP